MLTIQHALICFLVEYRKIKNAEVRRIIYSRPWSPDAKAKLRTELNYGEYFFQLEHFKQHPDTALSLIAAGRIPDASRPARKPGKRTNADIMVQIQHEVTGVPIERMQAMMDAFPGKRGSLGEEISEDEYQSTLAKLRKEKPGILNWMLQGYGRATEKIAATAQRAKTEFN